MTQHQAPPWRVDDPKALDLANREPKEFNIAYDCALRHCAEAIKLRLSTSTCCELHGAMDALADEFLEAMDE